MTLRNPVLVVDDDAVSRHVLKQALGNAAIPVAIVASGEAALAWLEHSVPSLVLLDLVMPAPDGYDVLHALRGSARTREIPVVVLTAQGGDEDVSRAFDLGADDFIRKPFRPVELVARIQSQLRMREYVVALGRKEHDAKVVLELTQALSSTLDFRSILFTVVRRIADVARVDRCSIVLVREPEDVGYVVAASDDRELRDLPIDVAKYPEIRQVLRTGEALVIADIDEHPLLDLVRPGLPKDAFRSLAILPIVFEDRPMGVLFLRGKKPVPLDQHELSLARTVANATAIALRNARILQSLRDQTQQINVARFEAERRLRTLERYADFFHSSADGIIAIDGEGNVLFSNPRAHELTGRTEAELARHPFAAVLEPRDHGRLHGIRKGVADGRFPLPVDFTIAPAPGSEAPPRIVSVSFGSVLREDSGAALVTLRDVTEDRATAAELTKTKEFLERVIESSVDAIISADLRGKVLLFNRAAERCYGYRASEVVGKLNVSELYPSGVAQHVMRLIRSEEHGGPGRLEGHQAEVRSKDGTRVPVLLSAALIFERGKPVGSVGVFTDLRERLQMEARLTEAQEELRAREKQAIVAELAGAAAHELNQPLTSVLGYAEIIRRRVDAETEKARSSRDLSLVAATAAILHEAERMAEIVRKIGKITRYETKSYVGDAKIIDLDRSSAEDRAADEKRT